MWLSRINRCFLLLYLLSSSEQSKAAAKFCLLCLTAFITAFIAYIIVRIVAHNLALAIPL